MILFTDWFWKKLSLYFGWLAMILLFVLVIFAANIEIKDLDLWLHLASGRYILDHFSIPKVDIFSATIAGQPWINHEWLFQVIVASVYDFGGIDAWITLQVLVVGITFLILLFLGYNQEKQVITLYTLFLITLIYQLRFFLRPDIFSLLFFVMYICVLSLKLHSRSSIWFLFGLQVIWSNVHGFFILGPLLVLLNIFSEWTKRHIYLPFEWNGVGRLLDEEYKRLMIIFPVVVAACFINPYFIKGALYPFHVLLSLSGDSKIFFEYIGELGKPFHWNNFFNLGHYFFYKLLILVSFGGFLLNFRKIDIGIFMFWLFFLLFSLSAVRNVAFFAFVAYFAILANSQFIYAQQFLLPQWNNDRFKNVCSVVLKCVLIFWIIQYMEARSLHGYYDFDRYERKSEHGGVSLRNYPTKAVDFLVTQGIKGRFFNDFNSGAYLIGRTYPDIKVFIDGRTEVYGGEYFKNYSKIWRGDTKLFDETADRYQLSGAFLNSVYVPAPKKTIRHLYQSKDWVLVYFDYDASIFLRNIAQNKTWIESLRVDLSNWKTKRSDLIRLGAKNVTPYRYINRAQALYNLGFYDQAHREAQEALRISPAYFAAYKLLGKIAIDQRQYEKGFELIRQAKILNPGDIETKYYLALAAFYLGDIQFAQEQCQKVIQANPRNYRALFLLSRIYDKQMKEEESQKYFEGARYIAPKEIKELMLTF